MRKPEYPKTIRDGNVVLKIYRVKHPTTTSGFAFTVAWTDAEGKPRRKQFADDGDAKTFAEQKADQLATGHVQAADFSADDRAELVAIREVVKDSGVPALSAVREWQRANVLCPGEVLAACEAWAARQNKHGLKPILVEVAVDTFIAEKEAAGKHGEQTYRAKLKPVAERFKGRHLHSITAAEWTEYLAIYKDGVTRNDHRKRAAALCRWAQRKGHLPRFAPLEILETERAKEHATKIGILTAETYGRLLQWFREHEPKLLGAVVLAGFCGIRSDEIHGKRTNRNVRQLWSDVHLDRKVVQVSVAKTNTPAWRLVPLCPAAVEWLQVARTLNPDDVEVCEAAGMERARKVAIEAKFDLPDNCFRHSFISHRVAQTQDKPKVALEAGNSVKEIDRRYRVPLTQTEGDAWFDLTVSRAAEIEASHRAALPQTG